MATSTIDALNTDTANQEAEVQARRKRARRTAWIVGGIAFAIFLLSILQMLNV
ncbi:MAG TPA: hypothetical protein VK519_10470 [Pinirhizobacter sp.]|jgi:hypothetical protein|uniref:hypothetical protein n=1 Tax=Pinirhizobacter sp. TaxID=2950432 RepID=UPI002B8D8E54|nr:hypothetical protein [Pinirhizobacter sp.]HMH68335.1 hypothetical protein [Pinirhizobacter sp.]